MNRHLKQVESLIFLLIFISFFVVGKIAVADTLGQNLKFNVNAKFDKYERTNLDATLRHVSDRLYFYVEDSYWNGLNSFNQNRLLNNISNLAKEFETNIYAKEIQSFGNEPNPGIDSDPRITVLLEEVVKGNGGYFDTSNNYSRQESSSSNEREMVAISIESVLSGIDFAKVFLAHEFQHLISFNQKDTLNSVPEDVWLNELRSEYAVSLVGYNKPFETSSLKRRFDAFIENPSDSLTEWHNEISDYAVINAFGEYLVEQYGDHVVFNTLKSKLAGIPSINKYFADRGYSEKFEDVFGYWMAAMYVNDQSQNPRLGLRNPDLKYVRVQPQQIVSLSSGLSEFSISQNIKPWQALWTEFNLGAISGDQSKSLKISVNGQTGKIFPVFYLVFHNNGSIQFGRIQLNSGKGSAYILNSEKGLRKAIVMVTDGTKVSDFRANEDFSFVNIGASIIETKKAEAQTLKDGSLIKRPREKEIYVIWGKYKRYLAPGTISLYGHLNSANAVEVEPAVFDSYQTSNYVKYVDDEKVYAVWPDESKHWLNITPAQWDASGRDWNAIFTINDLELNYYKTGADITR